MKQVVDELLKLPEDTVCLLPTKNMCMEINAEVLRRLPGEELKLVAEDSVDCAATVLQKVKRKLTKFSEDCTQTAGLENVIAIKIGCKVMLRCNIDVSRGLVNGAIGTIQSIQRSIDQVNRVESIGIKFQNNEQQSLQRVSTKFEIFSNAYVIRLQFPIIAASAITIHKSQGLTLNHVVTDIGNSVFTCGQAYVALSRVTSLDGLHLINFDPRSVKALDSAVIEYNRLRQKYCSNLKPFAITKQRAKKVNDIQWCKVSWTSAGQRPTAQADDFSAKRFSNPDGVLSFANSVMQCILCSPALRKVIMDGCDGALKDLCRQYISTTGSTLNCTELRKMLGSPVDGPSSQDAVKFLLLLMVTSIELRSVMQHTVNVYTRCKHCGTQSVDTWNENISELIVPKLCKSMKFDDLLKFSSGWIQSEDVCMDCHGYIDVHKDIVKAGSVLVFRMNVCQLVNGKTCLRTTNITAVPNSTFVIDGRKYQLFAAVSEVTTSRPGFEYKAIVSSRGKWIHCTDLSASKENWPRGSKGVYLLFYQQESVVPVSQKAVGKKMPAKQLKPPTSVKQLHKDHVNRSLLDNKFTYPKAGTAPAATDSIPVKGKPETSQSRIDPTTPVKGKPEHSTSSATSSVSSRHFKSCVSFMNNDGVPCYANVILQSLLQHSVLRSAFVASRYKPLRDLAYSYNDPARAGVLSSRQVRRMLGAPFSERGQQDASEFFMSLAMYCRTVENCLNVITRTKRRCTNCSYSSFNDVDNALLLLTIPEESSVNVTLSSLFTRMQQWDEVEGSHCTTCNVEGAVYEQSQQLMRAYELIVVQLKLYVYRLDGIQKINIAIRMSRTSDYKLKVDSTE